MSDDSLPEADRVEGAPHPRETTRLIGHKAAEQAFLDLYNQDHMHHAWLISGPEGIGKATFAWKIARFLLAQPKAADGGLFGDAPPAPETLDILSDHPVAARVLAGSEPRLKLIRRAWDHEKKRLKTVISIEEIRDMRGFLSLSAADGGQRVVIVDAADEMNVQAANGLLKMLEEPPADVTFLLVNHQPAAILPTIRSRCQVLRLHPLPPNAMAEALAQASGQTDGAEALAALAAGSVGAAIRLLNLGGLEAYGELVDLATTMPRIDRPRLLKLAENAVGAKKEPRFALLLNLFDFLIARLARAGVAGVPTPEAAPGEAQMLTRLSPNADAGRIWAEAQATLSQRARHGKAVNLDPAALLLDMGLKINDIAARIAARG